MGSSGKSLIVILALMIIVTVVSISAREQDAIPQTSMPWQEIDTWVRAENRFNVASDQPLVLHVDKAANQALIVENEAVKLMTSDNPQGHSLLQFDAMEAFYWTVPILHIDDRVNYLSLPDQSLR